MAPGTATPTDLVGVLPNSMAPRWGRVRPIRGSDHAASGPRAARHGVPHDDRDDRADGRRHDRADVQGAVDRIRAEQSAGEDPADERSDDAEHDMTDDAETLVSADKEARQVTGDRTKHDPGNDAHPKPPSLRRKSVLS